MQRKFLLFIIILAMSLQFACMDQQTNPLSSDELYSMPIIPQSTKILDAAAWLDNFVSVSSNGATYTFKAVALHNYNLEVGSILVGETENGMILRRITAIKPAGGFIEVTTTEASLVEAIKRGSGKYVLNFQNLANGGLGKMAAVESLSVDFDEAFGSGVQISGDFKLIPNMNGEFAIDDYTLQNFDMQFEAMGALNCLVEMNQGNVFLNTSKKLDITFDFAEIIIMIGDIPVPVQPQVEFYLEPQIDIIAPLTLNYTSEFDYSINLDYSKEGNSWNNESSIAQTADLVNHTDFSGDTDCNVMVRPQIKLTIFGREITDMQTFFQEQATADFGNNAVTPGWKAQSIISATVEANLDAISRQIPNLPNQSVFADTILLAENTAPVCQLISPAEDAVIVIGDTLNVVVLASDDHEDGFVEKVELLINNSVVDTTTTSPYNLQWDTNGFSAGNYTLTARVTDNDGLISTATIQVTLTPIATYAPTCNFVNPTADTSLFIGDSLLFRAEATDSDGTISSVSFSVNNQLASTVTTGPYEYKWTTTGLTAGTYTVKAEAKDNDNYTKIASRRVTLTPPEPVCRITFPLADTTYTVGDTVAVSIYARAKIGSIVDVFFYVDDVIVATDNTSPYRVEWNTAGFEPGIHTLRAVAIDNNGRQGISAVDVNLKLNNAPTSAITHPADGDKIYVGSIVPITVEATDIEEKIITVHFLVNGTVIGTDNASPYIFNWNTTDSTEGTYTIKTIVYDNYGEISENEISVILEYEPPAVTIDLPTDGMTYFIGDTVRIHGTASPNEPNADISKVYLFLDTHKIDSTTTNPISFEWLTRNAALGEHIIGLQVVTSTGRKSYTQIRINLDYRLNTPPTCQITTPTDGDQYTIGEDITLTATATDIDGTVTRMVLFAYGDSIGVDFTAPYEFSGNSFDLGLGSHDLTVVAYDDSSAETSDKVSIEVKQTFLNAMALVPGGDFMMGSNVAENPMQPLHTVNVNTFYIDRTEVTNQQYTDFLNSAQADGDLELRVELIEGTSYTIPYVDGKILLSIENPECNITYTSSQFTVTSGAENKPLTHVTWFGASTYAGFYDKRLPTEAEWEKAARGVDGRLYPWGNSSISIQNANFNNLNTDIVEVGQYSPDGDSPYGCHDMSGNVSEWCVDWYGSEYYQNSPANNPVNSIESLWHVTRGGAWNSTAAKVTTFNRGYGVPGETLPSLGFRCVRDIE